MIARGLCVLGTLAVWFWSIAPSPQAPPCPEHWTYHPPSGYLAPPIAADSAGTLVWREGWNSDELVAVHGGKTRWRKRLRHRAAGSPLNAMVLDEKLLVQTFGSRLEAHRISDGATAWTRDLRINHRQLHISAIARLGRLIVAAAAESDTAGWLVAILPDGRIVWRSRVGGAVARMAANHGQLSLLMSVTRGGEAPPGAVDTNGKPTTEVLPRIMGSAVTGDEIVFDTGYAVLATIAPLPLNCPPRSPSCQPPPEMLTVAGSDGDGLHERWQFTGPPSGLHVQLLLLSDHSVLLLDSTGVGRVASDGTHTPVCALPLSGHWSVAGLFHGDLVIAGMGGVSAYLVPGAPRLAASGWVMRGGGPEQDWAAR